MKWIIIKINWIYFKWKLIRKLFPKYYERLLIKRWGNGE